MAEDEIYILKLKEGHPFSGRQAEAMNLIFEGESKDEAIAKRMGLAKYTVKTLFSGQKNYNTPTGKGIFGLAEERWGKRFGKSGLPYAFRRDIEISKKD